jgi:hypothetical protein
MDDVDAVSQAVRLFEEFRKTVPLGWLEFRGDNEFPGCQSFLKRHRISPLVALQFYPGSRKPLPF